ncbi:MAG: DUF3387 domain-containing protein, partial [Acidobacteria bacterium]|nr:DUF3387 domain-containing protein [Acidobacteriota bacterium]
STSPSLSNGPALPCVNCPQRLRADSTGERSIMQRFVAPLEEGLDCANVRIDTAHDRPREKETMARAQSGKTPSKADAKPGGDGATTGYEADLWRMADALRGSMDAAEYKHVVLGLIFLKYISDAFEERHAAVLAEWGSEAAEDRDEYIAENIFWVPPAERLGLLPSAQEHILAQENGKERCLRAVGELSQAFALAVPHEDALRIRDDVAFFQAVQSVLAKRTLPQVRRQEELDHAVRQIVSRAVASEGVVDIFAAAGLKKPDISILSDEFLAEVRGMPRRNLAVELLQKLLKGELAVRRRKNVVQARSFAEMLEQTLRRYQNRAIEAAQVIEELIRLAREMREAGARGVELGLSEEELAFYDALETNDSAVQVLGDETLRDIARELVETVRRNVTIDWTLRENIRANLRRLVKRILRKHGYPPDKQEKATRTVLEQAEVLSEGWAVAGGEALGTAEE